MLFTWSAGGPYRNFDLSNIFFHPPLYINSDRSVKMFFFELVLECGLQAQGEAPSLLFANLVMMLSTLTYIFVRSPRMKVV